MSDDLPRTIAEFCRRNGLSRTSYFELRRRGQAPREMRVLAKVLICPEAESDWRREREIPDENDRVTIERLHQRGRKGGRRSAAKGDELPEAA